jgi:hypothetical protein
MKIRAVKREARALLARLALTSAAAAVLAGLGVPASAQASTVPSPLPCASPTGGSVTYQGGAVAADAQVYIIYWGTWWTSSSGKQARSYLDGMFKGVGATSWARTITQYCDDYGTVSPGGPLVGLQGASELAGTHVDASHVASPVDDSAIVREVKKYAPGPQAGGVYPIGLPVPVVVTPRGTVDVNDQSTTKGGDVRWCSYHDWMQQDDHEGGFMDRPYIALDYGTILAHAQGCQHGQGALGGLAVTAAHEWAEALTDPFGNFEGVVLNGGDDGWTDTSAKSEIADICETKSIVRVDSYPMPQLWSDKAGGCVGKS